MRPDLSPIEVVLEDQVIHCTQDTPTLCVECQERIVRLAILSKWQRVFNVLLVKEIEGTIILDGESHINLNLTVGDLFDQPRL